MEPVKVTGLLQEKTSAKGNKYICIDIRLTENYTKTVFIEKAEEEIIRLALSNRNVQENE